VIDKSHFELRRAPETNYTLGALYEVEMGSGNFFIGKINYRWRDDYHTTTNNAAEGLVKSFGMLDASIHFEFGDSWRLSLYGKNLTDEDYLLHALDPGTSFVPANTLPAGVAPSGYSGNQAVRVYPGTWSFGTVNPPRNFGVEVQYTF
jgi:iron complex outermembrane receptor protein